MTDREQTRRDDLMTDGLLTEQLLGRAISEICAAKKSLYPYSEITLDEAEGRLDNALRDLRVARRRWDCRNQ